jgi:hypothetical protein
VVGIKLYVYLDAEYTQSTSIYGVYIKETEKVVACIRGTVRRICKAISILDRSKSWSMNLATFCPPHTPLAEEIQIKRRWRLKAVAHTERRHHCKCKGSSLWSGLHVSLLFTFACSCSVLVDPFACLLCWCRPAMAQWRGAPGTCGPGTRV